MPPKEPKPGQMFTVPRAEFLRNYRALTPEEQAALEKEKAKDKNKEKKEKGVRLDEAREIFGDKDFLGPEAVESAWGVKLNVKEIPSIPFSRKELERAKELGQFLVLRVDRAPDGEPLTMQKMNEMVQPDFARKGKGKVLYNVVWYQSEEFYTTDIPELKWALTGKALVPDSTSKNYFEQTKTIIKYLDELFRNQPMPDAYAEAVQEFKEYVGRSFKGKKKEEIQALLSGVDQVRYVQELGDLKINQLTRQTPAEALYDLITYFEHTGERLLEGVDAWTNRRSSAGLLVLVGSFDAGGAGVLGWGPGYAGGRLGVSFSRSL